MAAQDLCALTDVRAALELPVSDTGRDTLISTLITAASEAIMNEVDREFAPATASATRRFAVENWRVNLAPYDLRTASAVTLHPESSSPQTLTAGSDYELRPVNAPSGTYTSLKLSGLLVLISDTAVRFGHALLDVTGAWGFASVPPDVNRACVITVASWLRKDVSALLAAGELDIGGGITPAFASTMEIPHAATSLLQTYYRLSAMVVV